jgi:hypothetical protein
LKKDKKKEDDDQKKEMTRYKDLMGVREKEIDQLK